MITTRDQIKGTMLIAMSEYHSGNSDEALRIVEAQLSAIEAAGVRLVPVNEKPGQGWLHEAVKDACLRSVKNMSGREPPQLLYAPILWAMQDALAASPYAPAQKGESR